MPAGPTRYQISPFSNSVARSLRRIQPVGAERIQDAIQSRALNPRPPAALQLLYGVYRIRVGNYRVIYQVDDRERTVEIGRIERRGEATYRNVRDLF